MWLFVVGVWGIYCAWLVFDLWWFTRFLLSSWPFIMLGVGSVAVAAYRYRGRNVRALVVLFVLALAFFQIDFAREQDTFGTRLGRRRFVGVARLVARTTDRNSVILSIDHSGSLRYYGGRMTIMLGGIQDGTLDTVVEWLEAHGAHPYLAVEEWELAELKRRFAGSRTLGALDVPPVAVYEWGGKMRLFDLAVPLVPARKTLVESVTDIGPTAVPVAPPGLVFTKTP
jgi:hypothetical protein